MCRAVAAVAVAGNVVVVKKYQTIIKNKFR
jgi:hypothetical protein